MRQASPGQWGEWQMSCPLWPWALALANVKLIYFKVFKISLSFFFLKQNDPFFFFPRFFMLCWVYVDVRGCKGVIARWLCNGEKQGGGAALQSRRGLFCMRFCCVASWYGNAKSKCWCVEENVWLCCVCLFSLIKFSYLCFLLDLVILSPTGSLDMAFKL